jgi:hypothetical protein
VGLIHGPGRGDTGREEGSRAGEGSCDARGGHAVQMLVRVYAMCWLAAGLGMAVVGLVLNVLERAREGRRSGVWGACCGAVWRLRGGGQARVPRGGLRASCALGLRNFYGHKW